MAGISFSVFKDKILSGAKRQTIRAIRKNPIKEGEKLYMWWKQRSSEREKLGETTCINVVPLTIEKHGLICAEPLGQIVLGRKDLMISDQALNEFAIADGFNNWQELVEFFESTHGLPFTGVLIQWDKLEIAS